MASCLDLTVLFPSLLVAWVCALFVPLSMLGIAKFYPKSRHRLPTHSVQYLASVYVCFGCMLTIYEIAGAAQYRGLILQPRYVTVVVTAILAVASGIMTSASRTTVRV